MAKADVQRLACAGVKVSTLRRFVEDDERDSMAMVLAARWPVMVPQKQVKSSEHSCGGLLRLGSFYRTCCAAPCVGRKLAHQPCNLQQLMARLALPQPLLLLLLSWRWGAWRHKKTTMHTTTTCGCLPERGQVHKRQTATGLSTAGPTPADAQERAGGGLWRLPALPLAALLLARVGVRPSCAKG